MPSLQSQATDFLLRRVVKRCAHDVPEVRWVRRAVESAFLLYSPTHPVAVEPHPRGEWIHPKRGRRRAQAILYLHGGGYFFGSPRTHRPVTVELSGATGLSTYALRYRLAPEHPFPAALEDAVAAYQGLLHEGYGAHNLVLAGDSAGGGLCLATLVALRDRGLPLPSAAVCFSPWTDLAGTGSSLDSNDRHCAMFTADSVRQMAQLYVAGADPKSPLVSPLYADLSGLPPTLVHVSDSEVLLDDSLRVTRKARRSGVNVSLKVWSQLPHTWQLFARFLPEARLSLAEAGDFIRHHLPDAETELSPPFALP